MKPMHRHGLSPDGEIGDHDVAERVSRLERAPWQSDPELRRDVLATLDVLAERMVGRRSPEEEELKVRVLRLRLRLTEG